MEQLVAAFVCGVVRFWLKSAGRDGHRCCLRRRPPRRGAPSEPEPSAACASCRQTAPPRGKTASWPAPPRRRLPPPWFGLLQASPRRNLRLTPARLNLSSPQERRFIDDPTVSPFNAANASACRRRRLTVCTFTSEKKSAQFYLLLDCADAEIIDLRQLLESFLSKTPTHRWR